MFIAVVSWWYTAGWSRLARQIAERLDRYYDFFSLDILLKTLFSPYRQISAGNVNGSLAIKWHAFIDRLVSRLIGAMIRTAVFAVGVVAIILMAIVGLLQLALWPVVPIIPMIGLVLALTGWGVR